MTTKLQTYPKYKPSGVDWLGNVPIDWQIFKFKELFQASNERLRNDPSVDTLLSVSGYRGVKPKDISSMEGQMPSDDISEYRIVRKGQLAVNTMWLNYAGLGVSEYEGYISPAYRAYYIKSDINNKFAHYLLRSSLYVQKYTSLLYGVRPNSLQVKPYDFEHIEILLPPLETQKRIADFLDEKTKVIDELVAKKEKLIEFLREKRAALITRAVTKGLNPNVKLKPSGLSAEASAKAGIDWLGDIPEGWEIRKLHTLGIFSASGIDKKTVAGEEAVKMVNYTNVYGNKNFSISLQTKLMETTAPKFKVKEHSLHAGDVLFTPSSETEKDIGVSATVLEDMLGVVYSYHLIRFRPRKGYLDIRYSKYFSNSAWTLSQFSALCKGTTRQILTRDSFNSVRVVIPPIETQKRIADFLDAETERIDKAAMLIESQIEKLKEYRSSLIYHAVTGKIKI